MQYASAGRRVLLTAGITIALGCGGGSASGPSDGGTPPPPPPPPPGQHSVSVTNNAFSPGDMTIAKGASVTWNWNSCSGGDPYGDGQTCVAHNVVMDDGSATSGSQSTGSYVHQFNAAGTFAYHCAIHGAAMSGHVIVQ
jgi:plastocyanin